LTRTLSPSARVTPSIASPTFNAVAIVMLAVVATRTESLISRACFTASTYPLVAASCVPVGSVTLLILELFTSTTPEPLGLKEILPFVFVLVISFPLTFILSTVKEVSPAIAVVVAPGFNALEPSVIALTATAPLDTVKSVASKEAADTFIYLYYLRLHSLLI